MIFSPLTNLMLINGLGCLLLVYQEICFLYSVFKVRNGYFKYPMGLSGLEPPTSRLSGVRSNQLSYKPRYNELARKFLFWQRGMLAFLLGRTKIYMSGEATEWQSVALTCPLAINIACYKYLILKQLYSQCRLISLRLISSRALALSIRMSFHESVQARFAQALRFGIAHC